MISENKVLWLVIGFAVLVFSTLLLVTWPIMWLTNWVLVVLGFEPVMTYFLTTVVILVTGFTGSLIFGVYGR